MGRIDYGDEPAGERDRFRREAALLMSGTALPKEPGNPGKPYRVLRRAFYRLNRCGVSPGMDVSEAKKVILSNQLALFLAMVGIPYFFVFELIGAPGLAWASLPG